MSDHEAKTKADGAESASTAGLAVTLRWMPQCYCGALATHEQTWSDRGPLYYCDREDCDKEARKAHDEDYESDRTGLERGECLWAETARYLTANGEVRGASRPAGEASSAEGATSTVVLGTDSTGEQ